MSSRCDGMYYGNASGIAEEGGHDYTAEKNPKRVEGDQHMTYDKEKTKTQYTCLHHLNNVIMKY